MACQTILVVEDNLVNLKLTNVVLRNAGFEVHTATDAEAALEMLSTLHPDLMLVDIQLPGMDGLELARRVEEDAATSDIVVVALTAYAMQGDEQRAREAGCDGYVSKPINTRALPDRLSEYLEQRSAKTALAASRGAF